MSLRVCMCVCMCYVYVVFAFCVYGIFLAVRSFVLSSVTVWLDRTLAPVLLSESITRSSLGGQATQAGQFQRDLLTIKGFISGGPLATLLGDAHPDGDHGTVHSGDGLFQASIPLAVLRHALISDEGRLVLDDAPTKCWLVKDVRRIDITDGRQPDSLPDEERAKT